MEFVAVCDSCGLEADEDLYEEAESESAILSPEGVVECPACNGTEWTFRDA
jgi:hypothetical protein